MKKITFLILTILALCFTTEAQNKYLNIATAGSYLRVTNGASFSPATASKTITFRIMIPNGGTPNTGTFNRIMSKLAGSNSALGVGEYGITLGSGSVPHTDMRLVASYNNTAASGAPAMTKTGNSDNNSLATGLNDGLWHHFALVLNDTDGKSRLYFDGNLIVTSTATGPIDMNNGTGYISFGDARTSPLLLAAFDDIRIWNSAFTANQVKTDITATINTANVASYTDLLAAYDFESATISGSTSSITEIKSATISTFTQVGTPANTIDSGSSEVIIPSTTWNGSGWSNGAPNNTMEAIISSDYSETTNLTAEYLIVKNNAIVSIPSGTSISLTGPLTVETGSSFTLNNNAKLIQSTETNNYGLITVKRNSSPMVRLDYTLWSSPVASQKLFNFSPNTVTSPSPRFYFYDNTKPDGYDNTGISSTSTFTKGKGFAIRAPNDYSTTPTVFTGTFIGIPINGSFTTALSTTTGYNLVGNPYPSPIDATAFVTANSSLIDGTLYFYSHNAKSDGTNYETNSMQYATWNSTGTAVAPAAPSNNTTTGMSNTSTPNGTIQVGQGFIVNKTTAVAGNLSFTNAMRTVTGAAANADQFFKVNNNTIGSKSATAAITTERHRLWLDLTNEKGDGLSQLLVGYVDGATNEVDNLFDGEEFGNPKTSLSSQVNGKSYTIQGRALPFNDTDMVPLAFKATANGTYTIALSKTDGLFASNQEILLKDNATGTVKDLKTGPYTFNATAGTNNTRFELAYSKSAINAIEGATAVVTAVKKQGVYQISTDGGLLKEIVVYDIQGREILKQKEINASTTYLNNLTATRGIFIVKATTENNTINTIKIIN